MGTVKMFVRAKNKTLVQKKEGLNGLQGNDLTVQVPLD